jgi:hypothetical protein
MPLAAALLRRCADAPPQMLPPLLAPRAARGCPCAAAAAPLPAACCPLPLLLPLLLLPLPLRRYAAVHCAECADAPPQMPPLLRQCANAAAAAAPAPLPQQKNTHISRSKIMIFGRENFLCEMCCFVMTNEKRQKTRNTYYFCGKIGEYYSLGVATTAHYTPFFRTSTTPHQKQKY